MKEDDAARLLFKFLRFSSARKLFLQLRKRQAKREHIVKEVLSTEEIYVTNLGVLVGVSNDNLEIPYSY